MAADMSSSHVCGLDVSGHASASLLPLKTRNKVRISGVIDAVGEEVEGWAVGDAVLYHGEQSKHPKHICSCCGAHTQQAPCIVPAVALPSTPFKTAGACLLRVARHTSHVTRHTSHVTRHASHVTRHTSHVTHHTSHVTRHTSHVTRHTSHVTRHTSHVTRHASRVTRHTSNVT